MNKELFDELTKKYASSIKELIDSNVVFTNIDTTIKYTFSWNDNITITASVDRKTNVMSINIAFVDRAYKDNRVFEIEYFLLHEMRHIYQHIQIAKYYRGEHSVDSLYIKRWIKEGKNYIKSIDKNGKLNIDYFKQDSELDAYAFSYAAMKYKYNSKYDSELYVPPIYKEELKEEFEMIVNDFMNFFTSSLNNS